MLRDAAGPTDPDFDLLLRWENTVNTPITSATFPHHGGAVAGAYTLIAASGSTIDITADDPKNELVGTGITVVADGSTVNNLGFALVVFSASLATGWTGKISLGALMAGDGSTSPRFDVGVVESGQTSTQRKITATNVGTETSSSSEIYSLPGFLLEGAGLEDYILKLKNHSDPARHDIAIPGDFVITFEDFQTGPPDTADVKVDGVVAIEDAELNETLYEYGVDGYIDGADKLKGLGIAFVDAPGDPTSKTFDLHVRSSFAWYEFAPDVAGSPGTWISGPLTLTESGQVSGVVTPSGAVNLWVRATVPGSADPGDMRLHNYRVRGLTV
jgi:hypothetical protein